MQPPKYQVIALLVPRAGAKMLVTGGDYCVSIGYY